MTELEVSGSSSHRAKLDVKLGKHSYIAAYKGGGSMRVGGTYPRFSASYTSNFCDAAVFQKVLAVYLPHRVYFAPESQELMKKA